MQMATSKCVSHADGYVCKYGGLWTAIDAWVKYVVWMAASVTSAKWLSIRCHV